MADSKPLVVSYHGDGQKFILDETSGHPSLQVSYGKGVKREKHFLWHEQPKPEFSPYLPDRTAISHCSAGYLSNLDGWKLSLRFDQNTLQFGERTQDSSLLFQYIANDSDALALFFMSADGKTRYMLTTADKHEVAVEPVQDITSSGLKYIHWQLKPVRSQPVHSHKMEISYSAHCIRSDGEEICVEDVKVIRSDGEEICVEDVKVIEIVNE